MERVGKNKLRRKLSFANNIFTCSKGWAFPTVAIDGADVATSLATNATAITTNNNRLDTLIDSGSTLDTISELKTAWESGDGTLNTAIGSLTTAAAADRQNIRNEFAATDTAINATLATARTDILELKPVRIYYVDAGRSDSYTETGSFKSPFKSLVTAMGTGSGELLEDSSTDHVIFKLAPGDYTGAISITKAAPNQTVEIHGSGSAVTNIQASAAWDATAGNVLYLRKFTTVRIKDCAVRFGAYGCYFREVPNVEIANCRFYNLGSSGSYHEFTVSKADQATYWAARETAGAHRSDGGAMRIRACAEVQISDCIAVNNLRGYRIQDCSRGRISDCIARSCLESGFYLASGSYTGANGCSNFVISGCAVKDVLNNAYLVIGGSNNVISACSAVDVANSAVMGWHTQDLKVIGCTFERATRLTYNGVGNDGDSFGCVYSNGGSSIISTGGYMLTAIGNVMTQCGQGRADAVYSFFIGDSQDNTQSSWRLIIDGNNSDAAQDISNTESVPLVSTRYPAAAGPTVTASRAVVSDGSGALAASATTSAQIGYLSGVTSSVQSQLDSKSAAFNGTNNKAVVTDGSGDLATATVSATELGYLSGVTSSLQDQIDNAGGSSVDLSNLNLTGKLDIDSSNAAVEMRKSGYGTTFKVQAGNNYGLLQYGGSKLFCVPESGGNGRWKFEGDVCQMPARTGGSNPPQNEMNSRGGFWYDVDNTRLMVRIGANWRVVSTEAP